MKQYETVIGLEVHVELATKTKIFCGCKTDFGAAPNTHVCPICTGMPGSLPILNKQVVEFALRAGLALNCQINQFCKFDRKNYFYPDNPQNYQISQLYLPICHDGYVELETAAGTKRIGIHEIHMEEDAGKLVHDEWTDSSLVDYNRSGVPLIEIVSEPDMRSADEVIQYLEHLQSTMQYLGVSDCRLQEGSMRADVNLSVREVGSPVFGTRTEMKNLNSFKAIARAIEGERTRQIELIEDGKKVIQETRRWDENKDATYSMRSKENAQDYRYFPEPDIPPMEITEEYLDSARAELPEMAAEKKARYVAEFGLPEYDADMLTGQKALADFFEEAVRLGGAPKDVANWMMGEVLRTLKEKSIEAKQMPLTPATLVKLLTLVKEGKINRNTAVEVFAAVFDEDADPAAYVKEHGMEQVNDTALVESTVAQVFAENPKSIADYRAGKQKAFGFLVGQTMKLLKGKADPKVVNQVIRQKLEEL